MKTIVRALAAAMAVLALIAISPSAMPATTSAVMQVAGGDPPDGG
ncbi:MAG: hypothetical protein QN178_12850 [Armatimonadota bacterium]|nr:hypothetical protein [Armatimonadota bacterium]